MATLENGRQNCWGFCAIEVRLEIKCLWRHHPYKELYDFSPAAPSVSSNDLIFPGIVFCQDTMTQQWWDKDMEGISDSR